MKNELDGRAVQCPSCSERFVLELGASLAVRTSASSSQSLVDEALVETSESTGSTARPESHANSALVTNHAGITLSVTNNGNSDTTVSLLGRFEIKAVLGQGAFGRVYRAYDPQLDRMLALKVPLFSQEEQQKAARFQAEAKAAGRLRHPNIVPTFDSGRIGDQFYIASQFIEGDSLSARMKKGKVDFKQAAKWTASLARALAYAHEMGIVHRDVKPQNVMLDAREEPQLMDFGLAKRVNEDSNMTTEGALLGTPAYMAPEQARGDTNKVGPLSDQYAVGAILYELLAGRRAFDGPPHAVLAQILTKEPESLLSIDSSIPKDLSAIAQKAMNKEASGRYLSCGELAEDLERWLRGETTLARPATVLEQAIRWRQRNPVLAVLIGALIGVISFAISGISIALWSANTARNSAQSALKDAENERARADEKAQEAINALSNAETERIRADGKAKEAEESLKIADTERKQAAVKSKLAEAQATLAFQQKQLAESETRKADEAFRKIAEVSYQPLIERAHTEYWNGNLELAKTSFSNANKRFGDWEWDYVNRLLNPRSTKVPGTAHYNWIQYSPDGKKLICAETNHTVGGQYKNGEGFVVLTSPVEGGLIRRIQVHPPASVGSSYALNCIFDESSELVLSAGIRSGTDSERELTLTNVNSGAVISRSTIPGHWQEPRIIPWPSFNEGLVKDGWTYYLYSISSDRKLLLNKTPVPQGPGPIAPGFLAMHDSFVVSRVDNGLNIEDRSPKARGKKIARIPHLGLPLSIETSRLGDIIVVEDANSLTKIRISKATVETVQVERKAAKSLAMSGDGKFVAIGTIDGGIRVFETSEMSVIADIRIHKRSTAKICFSPDGKTIASTDGEEVYLTPFPESNRTSPLQTKEAKITEVAFHDGDAETTEQRIAVLTSDEQLRIGPVASVLDSKPQRFPSISRLSIKQDGRSICGVNDKEMIAKVFAVDVPANEMATIQLPQLESSNTGGKAIIGFDWNADTKHFAFTSDEIAALRFDGTELWRKVCSNPYAPVFSKSGKALAYDRILNVVSTENGAAISEGSTFVNPRGFSHNQSLFAGVFGVDETSRKVAVRSLDPKSPGASMLVGHTDKITQLQFSPNDQRIFTGSKDGTVRVWDAKTGSQLLTLCSFGEPVGGLDVSASGKRVVSFSEKGQIRVFETE